MTNQTIHVLLVEDNPVDVRLLRELVTEGSSIRFSWKDVARLSAAQDILRAEPFDLVLLELLLPDSRGLDSYIRLQPHAISLPVVVLTNLDDEGLAIQAVRAGAQDYLIKGHMDAQSLVRALRYAIERKRTETTLRARNHQLSEQSWQKVMLASLMDELVVSLIHELNNPLARISVQLENLLAGFPPNDPNYGTMQEVQAEVERIGRRVASLLQASMESAGQKQRVAPDLADYLREHHVGNLHNDETHFFEELGAWVAGYISKGNSVTPGLLNHHPKQMKKDSTPANEPLSPREREILRLIARGRINNEIAKRLSMSVRTVERHRSAIMNKLHLQNRAELVAYAVQDELFSGGDPK